MNTPSLTLAELAEIKKELRTPSVGVAEFQLALSKISSELQGVERIKAIDRALDAHRKQLLPVAGLGFIGMTSEAWKTHYTEAEQAAREELLKSSAELTALDALEAEALEAQRRFNAKREELTRSYNEFASLPEKAARIASKLEAIDVARTALDESALRAQIAEAYRLAVIEGQAQRLGDADAAAMVLFTREIRLQTLADTEATLRADLKALNTRNAELAKLLGRPRNQLAK
jgi:DNA repair exonuclease SbcCD ATPase subunit